MLPELKIEANTLVGVLPRGDPPSPPALCWGLVVERTSEGLFKVRIGRKKDDTINVAPDQLIPCLRTDGSFKNPQRIFVENESEITLELWLNLLTKKGAIRPDRRAPTNPPESGWQVPIQKDVLVIILPGRSTNPSEPCWGLIYKKLGGIYDVQIGHFRYFGFSKIMVRPEQIAPVFPTNGSYGNPKQAIHRLRPQLLMHYILNYISCMQRGLEPLDLLKKASQTMFSNDIILGFKGKILSPQKPE